jgi:hypothetical protein
MTTGSGLFARPAVAMITRRKSSVARSERDMKTPVASAMFTLLGVER